MKELFPDTVPSSSAGAVEVRTLFIVLLALLALLSFGTAAAVRFAYRLSQDLPTVSQMQNIEQPLASKVLDKDGKVVHEFSIERRTLVPLAKIPVNLQNAVIAIEDRRFYKHWGIDLHRIFSAAFVNVLRFKIAQGGSTITQQLARNLYLNAKQSMVRKIREALTALQLESCYTKSEIFELYLNQVYLGAGAWGVEAASEQYFSKKVTELDINECATVAGIIQRPEGFRPDKRQNIPAVTARRNAVLKAMLDIGAIDKLVYARTVAMPVPARPFQEKVNVGAYFIEMVRKYVSEKYGDDVLYNGGLTIYTTLDRAGQEAADSAATKQITSLQHRLDRIFLDSTKAFRRYKMPRDTFLAHFDSLYALRADEYGRLPDSIRLRQAQIAVVALDAATGGIRTVIGGRNFDESKFNRVTMALRQPGSAFKPFVYTAAMEHGFTPASVVLDQPITLQTPEGEWRPENYDHTFNGPTTIRRALALSVNLVAIQVLMKVGPDVVVDYARRMGLRHDIQPIPSLAIGSCEVTPMELVSAYQIFANKGVAVAPYCVQKIVDKSGRVLEQHTQGEEHEVLSPQTAYLMSSLLQTVVCCGTASTIPGLGFTRPAAGKTGTTNNYSDAWFIGFTPQIVCCVWTGSDENRSLGLGVTGSLVAVPVWVSTMIGLHKNLPVEEFDAPEGIRSAKLCEQSHLIATRYCPKVKLEWFREETVVDTCNLHGAGQLTKTNRKDLFGSSSKRTNKKANKKRDHIY